MTNYPHQFEWLEPGKPEFTYVLAEQTDSGWQFHTKGIRDTRWRPADSSEDRINIAEELKAKALMCQDDKDDFGIAHTLKGWRHPTIVVISLALLVSGGVAISAGWQVALIVYLVNLAALFWGRHKGFY